MNRFLKKSLLILLLSPLMAFGERGGNGGNGGDGDNHYNAFSFIGFQRSLRKSPCGPPTANGNCAIFEPRFQKYGKFSKHFRNIKESKHPDVSVDKFIEIEKEYAARGEPLNGNTLMTFMSHLGNNPESKCEFDAMKNGGYGLKCGGREFPGLSEKLLKEKFAQADRNPAPAEDEAIANKDDEPSEMTVTETEDDIEQKRSPSNEENKSTAGTPEGGTIANDSGGQAEWLPAEYGSPSTR